MSSSSSSKRHHQDAEKYTSEMDERLAVLKADLEGSRRDIVNHISALYSSNGAFGAHFDLKNEPRNELRLLQHDVAEILAAMGRQDVDENDNSIQECSAESIFLACLLFLSHPFFLSFSRIVF
jgi:hypothetical protein